MINILERSLLEKAGHDNGFENVLASPDDSVHLGSARHRSEVAIQRHDNQWLVDFNSGSTSRLPQELARDFTVASGGIGHFFAESYDELALLLRRAAKLAQALPTQVADNFEAAVQEEITKLTTDSTSKTEVEGMVRQRLGQNAFRAAMLAYWGGACSVSGISIPEILRASHAKPWADCANDSERLDVFNGFLLTANLDALFDRFLISFSDIGKIIISERLSTCDRNKLGLQPDLTLRWIANEHLPYLGYHRSMLGYSVTNDL
ncbi:MAG: HNH endonuclease [Methylobacter sp.]|nr:HNH endonuclease [Methylobacter sp.]